MMENPRPEEEKIITEIRNILDIKDIRNLFRLEKNTKGIIDRIPIDIKYLFEHEQENYYKPVKLNNFWSNNYTKYESNSDRNKTLSVQEYINKISPYLKYITNNLKKSDTWKTQLILP